MDTKKLINRIAYLNISVAIIFVLVITFLDVSETTIYWIIALWFLISSLIPIISAMENSD